MAKYCITAVRRDNPTNDCVSHVRLLEYVEEKSKWQEVNKNGVSIYYIAELLSEGHTVLSGEQNLFKLKTGVPVEIELRIADNDKDYKISEMPEF